MSTENNEAENDSQPHCSLLSAVVSRVNLLVELDDSSCGFADGRYPVHHYTLADRSAQSPSVLGHIERASTPTFVHCHWEEHFE